MRYVKKIKTFNSKTIKLLLSLTMMLTIMVPSAAKEVFALEGPSNGSYWTAADWTAAGITIQSFPTAASSWPTSLSTHCSNTSDPCYSQEHFYYSGTKYDEEWRVHCFGVFFEGSNIHLDVAFDEDFPNAPVANTWYYKSSGKWISCTHVCHTHSFTYSASGNKITATCTDSTHNADLTLNINDTVTYNGSAQNATISNNKWVPANFANKLVALPNDSSITYEATGTSSLTDGKAINAGTYLAKLTLNGKTAKKAFTIVPLNATNLTASTSYTSNETMWTGSELEPEITVKYGATTLTKGTDYEVSGDTKATAPGEYTITITCKEGSNFTGTITLTWKILGRTFGTSDITVTPYSGTYDGQNHPITVSAPSGSTITYSTTKDGTYASTNPTFKNAGSYTVYYKVNKDGYNEKSGSSTVTISQKEVTLSWTDTDLTYNKTAQKPKATVTNKALNTDVVNVSVTGEQTNASSTAYTATANELTGTDAGNYKLPATKPTQNFTIKKAKVTAPTENTNTFTYNKQEQTYTLQTNDNYNITNDKRTNAGSQTVNVSLKDPNNYEWADTNGTTDKQFTFTINKVKVTAPTKDETVFTYNTEDQTYTLDENSLYEITNNVKKDADTYKVNVALKDKDNYVWSNTLDAVDKEYDFIINPADSKEVKVVINDLTFTYDKENPAPQSVTPKLTYLGIELVEGTDFTIVNNNETSTPSNTATDPGKYTLVIELKGNYTGTITKNWSINEVVGEPVEVELGDETETYNGTLTVITSSNEQAPSTTINNPTSVLTEEELEGIKDGSLDVEIIVTIDAKEADEINEDSAKAITNIAKTKNIRFLDISIDKVLNYKDGNGVVYNTETKPVTKTDEEVEITIDVPKSISNTPSGYSRKYTIIRSHLAEVEPEEGQEQQDPQYEYVAKKLETKYSSGKLTFKTNLFSDYAVMYVDTLIPIPASGLDTGAYIAPNTGVGNSFKPASLLPLALAVALIVIKRKNN